MGDEFAESVAELIKRHTSSIEFAVETAQRVKNILEAEQNSKAFV